MLGHKYFELSLYAEATSINFVIVDVDWKINLLQVSMIQQREKFNMLTKLNGTQCSSFMLQSEFCVADESRSSCRRIKKLDVGKDANYNCL